MRAVPVLLLPLLVLLAGCSAPPQKEIDLAQGAIDAARAAGAEQYATETFTAATSALQQAHDAVGQRDYRLALSRALDAHERAQDAAKGAADGKARARSDAEVAIVAGSTALQTLRERLKTAEAEKVPRRDLERARTAATMAETTLQDARAALKVSDYTRARQVVDGLPARITAQITALEAAEARKPTRAGRRLR
jgi:hypothetical protein